MWKAKKKINCKARKICIGPGGIQDVRSFQKIPCLCKNYKGFHLIGFRGLTSHLIYSALE